MKNCTQDLIILSAASPLSRLWCGFISKVRVSSWRGVVGFISKVRVSSCRGVVGFISKVRVFSCRGIVGFISNVRVSSCRGVVGLGGLKLALLKGLGSVAGSWRSWETLKTGVVYSTASFFQLMQVTITGTKICYRVTHKGWDYRNECTEFAKTSFFPYFSFFQLLACFSFFPIYK